MLPARYSIQSIYKYAMSRSKAYLFIFITHLSYWPNLKTP